MTSPITTINELTPRDQFTANGTQTTFSVDWPARQTADVVVEFNSGESPSIGYTFDPSNLNDDEGFSVIFNSPPPSGTVITVYRRGALERQANYGQQKAFTAATVNAEFADQMLRIQELKRDLNRTLRLPISDPAAQLVLPAQADRASKYFTFDENGNPSVSGEADSGSSGSAAGDWGSDYGLVFDGETDQAEALQAVLDAAVVASRRVVRLRSNEGALVIGARVKVPAGVVLDTSQIEVHYIDDAELAIFGEYEELPETNLFRLAADAEPGDTTITVDASDYGSHTLLAADAFGVLRGENDANGNAIQRHEFRIVSKDAGGGISALVLTIDPPIPDDQGTFTPINEGSAWEPGDSGIDRSLITVRTASLLAGNVARGDISFDVADGSLFSAGGVAMLQDDRLASDPGTPDDGQPIRQEMVRIRSVATNTVTLEQRVGRDFLTSENAVLIKVNAVKDAHIVGGKIKRIEASPASPASRKHGALIYFGDRCSISGIDLDEDLHTYSLRGQAARATRSIDCKIFNVRRVGPKNTSSGDGNGIGNYYSTNTEIFGCYTERCRHGMTNQGSTRANRHDNLGVNNLINTLDDHGVYETDTWDHDNRVYGGGSLAADSTQQLGATYGNTRWHEGSHWAVSENNVFVNFFGTSDGGVAVRPGTTDLVERNIYTKCRLPVRVNADRRAPGKQIARIVVSGTVLDDPDVAVSIDGQMPAWESEAAIAGTTARPTYLEDESRTRLYSTTDTGNLGTENPTHTDGTVANGDADLTYVGLVSAQAATIDEVWVRPSAWQATAVVSEDGADNVTISPDVPGTIADWLGDGDKRLDVAIAALVGATAIPEGTSAFAVRDDAGDVKVYTPAAGGTLIFDDDADTVAAVAKLAASTFAEIAVTATRELTSADANFQIVTESEAASGVVRKVLVPLHGTPSTAIALQIPANMEHGAEILVRRPGNQTGAVTVALVGAGSINGDTAAVTIPRKRLFAIYVSNAAGNAPTVETSTTLEDLAIETIEASGTLVYETHHNANISTTGDVTIPTTVGMAGTITAGGAHTISFNSTTSAALSTGDIVAYLVTGATTINLVRIPNSSRLALS